MQVIRHPRVERSPALEPLFERCIARGAPHSLHRKPTHDWSLAVSVVFFAGAALSVMELLNIALPLGADCVRTAIVVRLDDLPDRVRPQRFPSLIH